MRFLISKILTKKDQRFFPYANFMRRVIIFAEIIKLFDWKKNLRFHLFFRIFPTLTGRAVYDYAVVKLSTKKRAMKSEEIVSRI